MHIASVGTAFPPFRYTQSEIAEALAARWRDRLPEPRLLTRLHANCGVAHRAFVFPLDHYPTLVGFTQTNNAWIEHAVTLGRQAIEACLTTTIITPEQISAIFFTSVTGIASPTIDARLINLLPFPTHIKRTPIFGLGCVAGAAGIARAADYLRAFPRQHVLLLSVELCSLTWQDDDQSIANLISTGLFADGAAAVLLSGAETPAPTGPKILATRSTFYRHTEHIMGWDIGDNGFKIVLSPDVPKVVLDNLKQDVDTFLTENQLTQQDIASWIFHSGGPKVLEAVESALTLPKNALAPSWQSLSDHGNLSAASVLTVLEHYLKSTPGQPGTYSILAAMGPAFCLELVLLPLVSIRPLSTINQERRALMTDIIASAAPLDTEKTEHGHKVPSDPKEINPKIASDIAFWSKEFHVSGDILHEAIRTHGVHVDKVRAALASHSVNLT